MKRKTKQFLLCALAIAMCLCLAACAQTTATPSAAQTRTVKDSKGTDIAIPLNVVRVCPRIGAFSQITSMLGAPEKIVASITTLSATFKKVFPTFGNKAGKDSSNIEDIIASGAQVAYGPNYSDDQITQLNKAGIAVVRMDVFSTVEQMKACVTTIGSILGGGAVDKAKAFNTYYDGNIAYVSNITKNLKTENKVRILALYYSAGAFTTINASDICSEYIKAAGGINVAAEFQGTKSTTGSTSMTVNAEQIVAWKPDLIITMTKDGKDAILKDASLKTLAAVKSGKVYVIPEGTYPWSVRSGEGAMMPLWVGKIMYPELFGDLNMEQKVKEFFKTFYNYDLSAEELVAILKTDINK